MKRVKIETLDKEKIELDEEVLTDLSDQLKGNLLKIGDEGYDEAREVFNGMIDKKPALIVRALGPADVMSAVNFIQEHQLKNSIRAGGHNVAGSAIAENGLVIDVSRMNSVHVNPEEQTAVVESGALLGDVDHETAPFDMAVPLGVVSQTGVAGLTLHGGVGWLSRKHGLTIDNLKSIEVVTPDGELVKASKENHPDLFWALRGGGGNFGVVTAFEFDLHPVSAPVSALITVYPLDKSEEVITFARDYMASAPEELMLIADLGRAPAMPGIAEEDQGKPSLILFGCYFGSQDQAEEITGPLKTIVEPIADLSFPVPFKDFQQLLDASFPVGKLYYWKSIYLDEINNEVIDLIEEYVSKQPSPDTTTDVYFLGAAMSQVPLEATPFYNRKYPYMVAIQSNWFDSDKSEANISWARSFHSDLEELAGEGRYLNIPGNSGDLDKRELVLRSAYGDNLERLKKVKSKYDPDNIMPGLINISS